MASKAPSLKPIYRRVVIKVGTSLLTLGSGDHGLNREIIADLVRQICLLRDQGVEALLVTSGAVAAGREALESRPRSSNLSGRRRVLAGHDIRSRQVMAAVGQSRLMHAYQEMFGGRGHMVAQTLLTINDLTDRQAYLNVGNTLTGLLELGVIPILNENDVVAVDEIGEVFGDNDRLSALVANLVDADLLVILTDTDGLYTADPNLDPSAELIPEVNRVNEDIMALAGKNFNPWARGGMPTKIDAARLVTSSGMAMVMCRGSAEGRSVESGAGAAHRHLVPPGRRKAGSQETLDVGRNHRPR